MSTPRDEVYVRSRAEWRQWLCDNAARSSGIWLVYDKGPARTLSYDDIVEEALCFGWIDSKPRRLDETRAMLYVAPRTPTSAWSRLNQQRAERLIAAGLMQPAGLAAIETAKRNGSWAALEDVEQLIEPDDLRAALAHDARARDHWDRFPRSAKRAILEWIGSAKTPETRAKRVAQTVTEAAAGRRANQWRQPGNRQSGSS